MDEDLREFPSFRLRRIPQGFELQLGRFRYIKYAALAAREADCILLAGDWLAHGFSDSYYQYAGNGDPRGFYEFIDKTITFLTQRIREQFPRIPIYPALGNADSYCGDYQLQPKGEFLRRTADTRKDYFATATMSKLSCKPSRPADTMRLLHPGRPKLALRLQEGKVPGWTAHAVAAGAVSERNPAKNPIKKVNRIVIVQYSDVSRI